MHFGGGDKRYWIDSPQLSGSALRLAQSTPAAGVVMGNHGSYKVDECLFVDRLAPVYLNRPGSFIVVTLVDYAFRIRRDGIINEDVHMVSCGKQSTDIAIPGEVRSVRELDRLFNIVVSRMYELANISTDQLLPIR
jgi:hypothetical protein